MNPQTANIFLELISVLKIEPKIIHSSVKVTRRSDHCWYLRYVDAEHRDESRLQRRGDPLELVPLKLVAAKPMR